METRPAWNAALALMACLAAGGTQAAQSVFDLTPADEASIQRGNAVIHADLDARQRRGTVRAALLIDAPPDVVFRAMTHCAEALEFVPHLRGCRVDSRSVDASTQLVAHEVDLGWYTPAMRYVFRADLIAGRRIAFRQVAGDFLVNQGAWEFEPDVSGERTLVRYQVQIEPPAYVPDWIARATFQRTLPRLLDGLRRHCEEEQNRLSGAITSPDAVPR